MVVTDYNEQFLDKRGTDHLIEELKAYVDGIVNGNIDLSNYVTKEELQAKLDALHINIDLSAYATKEELTNAINSIVSSYALKTEIPNKVSELENDSGYLTEHQDLSDYARTADLHSHTNKNVLDDISATDVSNWNDAKVHSQTPHAPSTAQPNFIEDIKVNGASLMISDKTVNIDLSKYAKKTDIPSTDGLATTKYVDNAIANIPTGGDVDLSNYYTKEETNALIPSTEGFATKEYVDNSISNIPTTDLTGYATEEYVNNAISNIPSADLSNYYTKEETNMLIPSLDGYVTDTELEAKGYLTEHQDLSNYATKDEIPDVSGFITEIPEEYVTETELSAKGYLTEHQDLSAYAKKTEIPTTLPANGGNADTVNNHTVKSDVPENAVFTDTIYDDTEVKGSIKELNSNLDTLEFGEVAGGKNLVYKTIKNANIETNGTIIATTDATDIHVAKVESGKTYTFTADSTVYAFYSVEPKLTIQSYDNSRVTSGSRTITIPSGVSYLAFRTLNTYTTVMVEEGSTATTYEPYIPSVKMLADKIYNNTKVDVVLYDEFDIKADNIQNRLYLLGDILFGSLYFRFDEEHNPLIIQEFSWVDIGYIPQIVEAPQLYNCISYADIEANDYAQGDVRVYEGKLQVRIKKQPTVSRNNWYIFYKAVCMKVTLAE